MQIEELGKDSQLVGTRNTRTSVISKTSSAKRVLYLKVKALKEQEELLARLEKLASKARIAKIEREIADMHEVLARTARIAEIERERAKASISQGTSFRNISSVDSFTEDTRWMDKTETAEKEGANSNIAVSVHSKSEKTVKFFLEGKFSAPMRDSNLPQKPTRKLIGKTYLKLLTEHADEEQHHNQK